jgi:hypothetical protein
MDLFRDEYNAKKPKEWGNWTYERLEKRKAEAHIVLAPKPHVRALLESCPTEKGPLDATEFLTKYSDDDLCEVFMRLPRCETLILNDFEEVSDKVLRCISMSMGPSLTEIDLSGSAVKAKHLEILTARFEQLKIIRLSRCANLDSACMSWFARYTYTSTYITAAAAPALKPLYTLHYPR